MYVYNKIVHECMCGGPEGPAIAHLTRNYALRRPYNNIDEDENDSGVSNKI